MRDQVYVLQELIELNRKSENGLISSQELYESCQPLLRELTHLMYLANIKTEQVQTELREMQVELQQSLNDSQEIVNEMQSYDITVRMSYNFINEKGYADEFYEYLSKNLDDASAEIRRSGFKLVQNFPN